MESRIADLHVNKIIHEYTFLKTDTELKKELIEADTPVFLEIVNTLLSKLDPTLIKEPTYSKSDADNKKNEIKIDPSTIDNNTKIKLKKIYREIVKVSHPDKVNSVELNNIYLKAKESYENFDLFELYFIAKDLKLNFKLSLDETKILSDLIELKKEEIKQLESSFIWLWLNSTSEFEKDKIINNFIKTHYLINK